MFKNKIFLIDEDIDFRCSMHKILCSKHYEVRSLSNAQEALDVLEIWTPDLILCSTDMRVMNGYLFHEKIKQVKALSKVSFVFLSEIVSDDVEGKCRRSGAETVLYKSLGMSYLLDFVDRKFERYVKLQRNCINLYSGANARLSHEVRTSLSGILGGIELLEERKENLQKGGIGEVLYRIKVSGERLNRTMQNVFIYQKFISEQLEVLSITSTNLKSVFYSVLGKIQKVHSNSEMRLALEIADSDIKISRTCLDFIIYELVDNALKFSSDKIITVVGEYFNGSYYRLQIKDLGIGFKEEELLLIDAGQQFNREVREQQGLGLGLYLSKEMVKKANGQFIITSQKDEGTTISLFFPLHQSTA